jgi:phage-related protein
MKRIYAYKDCFSKLMQTLNDIERKKIKRALLLLETEDKIPYHYIKYLMDGIYELRVTCGYNEFRIMFINDGNDVVILLNAFRKKTQKTPKNELERAIRLKNEYYGQKEQ